MKILKVLGIFILVVLLLAGVIIGRNILNDLSSKDSSAIVGGKLEKGYPFAGYLLADLGNNRLNVCGGAFLTADLFLTAAHCVNNTISIVVGLNEFSDDTYNITEVKEFEIYPDWGISQATSIDQSAGDLAILKLKEPKTELSQFAEMTVAQIGCNYEVIGYGQTGESTPSYLNRQRKSATLCIEEIYDKVMLAKGQDGGLCFGDSGSPVFEKGTNKLVGIMSAAQMDENGKCNIANLALVNNPFEYSSFINLFANKNSNTTSASLELCSPADINGNNKFDITDFKNISEYYLKSCKDDNVNYYCGNIDFNNDGFVNIFDISSFSAKFGKDTCR